MGSKFSEVTSTTVVFTIDGVRRALCLRIKGGVDNSAVDSYVMDKDGRTWNPEITGAEITSVVTGIDCGDDQELKEDIAKGLEIAEENRAIQEEMEEILARLEKMPFTSKGERHKQFDIDSVWWTGATVLGRDGVDGLWLNESPIYLFPKSGIECITHPTATSRHFGVHHVRNVSGCYYSIDFFADPTEDQADV